MRENGDKQTRFCNWKLMEFFVGIAQLAIQLSHSFNTIRTSALSHQHSIKVPTPVEGRTPV